MKRFLAWLLVLSIAGNVSAMHHAGFEVNAFNRVYPASYAKSFVFSPLSFEIDCVLYAQMLDTLAKAKVAERIGSLSGFEMTYRPVLEEISSRTNGCSFLMARGFCVPYLNMVGSDVKRQMMNQCGAIVAEINPKDGAEAWFKTEMEGQMPGFSMPDRVRRDGHYSFYDLAAVYIKWEHPFRISETKEGIFTLADGKAQKRVEYMHGFRKGGLWDNSRFRLLTLPMAGGNEFFALTPKKGRDLSTLREEITSLNIDNLLLATKSITEGGVFNGPLEVTIPKIDTYSKHNIATAMNYFTVPTDTVGQIPGLVGAKEVMQHVRFRIDERAVRRNMENLKHTGSQKVALDSPFIYFVYNTATSTLLVAGQFTGQ